MTRTMTATEVKARILRLLDEVALGEEIEITKHGRPVARLVPASNSRSLRGCMAVEAWLDDLASRVRTANLTPAIAATAARLRSAFPGDPCDRIIYATAIEHGWPLVTKDKRLRQHRHPRKVTVW